MWMADGSLLFDTKLDSTGLEKGVGGIEKNIGAVAKKIGLGLVAIKTGITVLLKKAVDFGSEFETSLAKTSTMFGGVEVDTDNLTKKIISLSNATGTASKELSDSLYNALSAGIPVTQDMGESMEFLEKSVKLAKAGFTDTDTAVTSVSKVLNAYNMELKDADAVQKVLIQTQNNGITTIDELGSVLSGVTPTAAALSVSFEQVGAGLATLTASGTATPQAVTQLNSVLGELGKEGTKASKALEKATAGTELAGKSFVELQKEGVPLNEILDKMSEYAAKNNLTMLDLFSSLEAGKGALSLSGEASETFAKNLVAMGTEIDVVDIAYKKVTNTLENSVAKLKENAKNLGIAVFKDLREPLQKLAEKGSEYINNLNKAFELKGISGAVEILGDIIADMLTELILSIPKMFETTGKFLKGFIDGVTNKSKDIIKSGASLIEYFLKAIGDSVPYIISTAQNIMKNFILGIAEKLPDIIQSGVNLLIKFLESIGKGAEDGASMGSEIVANVLKGIMAGVVVLLKNLPAIVKSIFNVFATLIKATYVLGVDLLKSLWEGIKSMTKWLTDKVSNLVSGLFKKQKIDIEVDKKSFNLNESTRGINALSNISNTRAYTNNYQNNTTNNFSNNLTFTSNENLSPFQILEQLEIQRKRLYRYG